MFVVFIPDWQKPLTPAIPRLADTIYCQHNILLESGNHQYITGILYICTIHIHILYIVLHHLRPLPSSYTLLSLTLSYLSDLPSSYTLLSPGNQHVQGLTHYDAVHGTQVYVLQNDSAVDTWPLEHNDMEQLRNAMSYNREWG